MMPLDAPPPLQIAAAPYCPTSSWCSSVTSIRLPELPSACPSAMAPPRGFTLSVPSPMILALALMTAAKASLNSQMAMSSFFRPDCLRSFSTTDAGAMGKSMGSVMSVTASRGERGQHTNGSISVCDNLG
jgi:hypothetical protein